MNSEPSYVNELNPQPEPPAPAPQNFFSRLIGVYFSPGETFQDIGRTPSIVLPIIVLILLTIGVVFVVSQRISFEKVAVQRIDDGVAEGKFSAEQAEQQKEGIKKMAPFFKFVIPFIAGIFVIVAALAIAGLAKLVSSMVGVENKFLPLFGVTIYTMLAVSLISSVLLIILLYLKPADDIDPNNPLGSNLAALLSMAGVTSLPKFLKGLLTYVDVFYIWKVVLLGIGYAAVSRKLKTSTAIIYASVGALVFAVIGAAWSALFG